jgi:hypothetical protein
VAVACAAIAAGAGVGVAYASIAAGSGVAYASTTVSVTPPPARALTVTPASITGRVHRDRYALGDSVMLGAKSALKGLGFAVVDAKESRQAYDGPRLLRQRGAALPTNVVVHLGTNGTFPLDVCKSIVHAAGADRRVFFVTVKVPRSWQTGNNQVIHACDASFAADRVHVIDWKAASANHDGWFWGDHIHLRPAGALAFALLIDGSVDKAIADAHKAAVNSAGGSGVAGTHTT